MLMFPTLWIAHQELIRDVPFNDYLLLIISGIIGISLADTLFFKSLNLLGAGVIAIVDSMYSPFVIVVSLLWLGELMTSIQFAGTALIISAILTVTHSKGRGKLPMRDLMLGLFWSSSSLAMMAPPIPSRPVLAPT